MNAKQWYQSLTEPSLHRTSPRRHHHRCRLRRQGKMAFWRRIAQSKLKHLSSQFKRTYLQIPHVSSLRNIAKHTRSSVIERQCWVTPKRDSEFCSNMRFFAARTQSKSTEKEKPIPRMNEQITNQFVRLVTEEGHSVVSRNEALKRASERQLDLVEVDGFVDPPACKMLDLKREKYLQQQRKKELKKKSDVTLRSGSLKEVRFNRKIEQNDLKYKADQVKRLMERGYRVKCLATVPTQYDMERPDLVEFEEQNLQKLISRFAEMLGDVATVESDHRTKGKQAFLIVRHTKFGPLKGGKKATVAGKTTAPAALDTSHPTEDPTSGEETPDSDISPSEQMSENASLPYSSDAPQFLNSRPAVDYSSASPFPSSQSKPSLETENRYSKREPNNCYAPRNSVGNRGSVGFEPPFPNDRKQPASDSNYNGGQGVRDSVGFEPQFPNQRRQPPFDSNVNSGPALRNSVGFEPHFSNQQSQQPSESNANGDPGMRNSVRFEPRFPNQRR